MTECSRCGDCCERINSSDFHGAEYDDAARPVSNPDKDWERWCAVGWGKDEATSIEVARRYYGNRLSVIFARAHWSTIEHDGDRHTISSCDAFDPVSRLCTAHDDRPPICSGYPWYGQAPQDDRRLSPRCSFNVDLDPNWQPVDLTTKREEVSV